MLALKLYWNLNRNTDPNEAFCHLYQDLEKHESLDRPATSILTIAASRLAYHFQECVQFLHTQMYLREYQNTFSFRNLRSDAVSSCQHVPVGNQSSTTILTWAWSWRSQQGCQPWPSILFWWPSTNNSCLEVFDAAACVQQYILHDQQFSQVFWRNTYVSVNLRLMS